MVVRKPVVDTTPSFHFHSHLQSYICTGADIAHMAKSISLSYEMIDGVLRHYTEPTTNADHLRSVGALRDPAVRSGPVFKLFAKTEDQTKRSGPVLGHCGDRTTKDQDRGLVLVFERSWSDRTTDKVKNRINRYKSLVCIHIPLAELSCLFRSMWQFE
jgi:hypothetical protein